VEKLRGECEFVAQAVDFFLKCGSLRAAELFPFFPEYTKRWGNDSTT
jgi:hypothetical protein